MFITYLFAFQSQKFLLAFEYININLYFLVLLRELVLELTLQYKLKKFLGVKQDVWIFTCPEPEAMREEALVLIRNRMYGFVNLPVWNRLGHGLVLPELIRL